MVGEEGGPMATGVKNGGGLLPAEEEVVEGGEAVLDPAEPE